MFEYFIGPEGVFPSIVAAWVFAIAQFGFMATESRRRRSAPADAARGARAFPPMGLALLVGLAARLGCGFLKIGVIRGDLREWLVWLGFGLVLAGWGMRFWAQRELGRFFTGEVAVQRDHRVVQTGPYRWVRHPAYTGGLLASLGFGLMLSTWLGALISGGLLVWAYLVRVPREEALLVEQLGDTYRAYAARTKRFIPFLF
jgi:protein-S-isoprenylcysteine O-methyltransferase Ste14